jgi:hypothetical protein
VLGAYLCYASTASEFFWRIVYLFAATFAGSIFQILSTSIGHWGIVWLIANGYQLLVVFVLIFLVGWPLVIELSVLVFVSAVILFFDFLWQLGQLAPAARRG